MAIRPETPDDKVSREAADFAASVQRDVTIMRRGPRGRAMATPYLHGDAAIPLKDAFNNTFDVARLSVSGDRCVSLDNGQIGVIDTGGNMHVIDINTLKTVTDIPTAIGESAVHGDGLGNVAYLKGDRHTVVVGRYTADHQFTAGPEYAAADPVVGFDMSDTTLAVLTRSFAQSKHPRRNTDNSSRWYLDVYQRTEDGFSDHRKLEVPLHPNALGRVAVGTRGGIMVSDWMVSPEYYHFNPQRSERLGRQQFYTCSEGDQLLFTVASENDDFLVAYGARSNFYAVDTRTGDVTHTLYPSRPNNVGPTVITGGLLFMGGRNDFYQPCYATVDVLDMRPVEKKGVNGQPFNDYSEMVRDLSPKRHNITGLAASPGARSGAVIVTDSSYSVHAITPKAPR